MSLLLMKEDLFALVCKQLGNLFILHDSEKDALKESVGSALLRCEYCFVNTDNKYYHAKGGVYFNPFHSGQYSIFLYYLSNSVFVKGEAFTSLADRIYYLNKALNGLDLFYEVCMPDIFFLDHPVGSVLGRANYGERFSFSQNCTVGNNKGVFPTIGDGVSMMSGSKILGASEIGDNVIISAGCYVKDTCVPSNSVVFGSSPNLVIKENKSVKTRNAMSDVTAIS